MKVKITELPIMANGVQTGRHYTATNSRGETVESRVINAGYGWKVFWDKVKAKWPKAYVG